MKNKRTKGRAKEKNAVTIDDLESSYYENAKAPTFKTPQGPLRHTKIVTRGDTAVLRTEDNQEGYPYVQEDNGTAVYNLEVREDTSSLDSNNDALHVSLQRYCWVLMIILTTVAIGTIAVLEIRRRWIVTA